MLGKKDEENDRWIVPPPGKRSAPISTQRQPRRPDGLRITRLFGPQALREVAGRSAGHLEALGLQLRAHVGRLQHGSDVAVDLLHDGGRRAGRREVALPAFHRKPGRPSGFGHGGHRGQGGGPVAGGHRQGPQLAGTHMVGHGGQGDQGRIRVAGQHVHGGRAAAGVGDVVHPRARLLRQDLVRHVGDAAIARQPQADAFGPGPGPCHVVGQAGDAGGRMHYQDLRIHHCLDDGREALVRVVGQPPEQDAVERESLALLQQRVAVRRCLGHPGRTDGAAGTGHVLHDHALAPECAEPVGQRAGELVRAAAGCHRNDDAHGPGGEPGRRVRCGVRTGGMQGGGGEGGQHDRCRDGGEHVLSGEEHGTYHKGNETARTGREPAFSLGLHPPRRNEDSRLWI